jgi:hypothetical protein
VHDELRYNARQAAAHLRMAQNVLKVQPGGDGKVAEELRHRLSTALALVDAAYVEVGRLERLRKGDGDAPPPAS